MSTTTIRDSRCSECGEWLKLGHAATCSRHPANTRPQLVSATTYDGALTVREGDVILCLPPASQAALRALRLWHWQQAIDYRNEAVAFAKMAAFSRFEYNIAKSDIANRQEDFHIKAVQALNDCFEIDDTAEKDAAK